MRCICLPISMLLLSLLLVSCGRSVQSTSNQPTQASSSGSRTSSSSQHTELRVFAAASLINAFGEMDKEFERAHPGVKITFSFAGSQDLAQQIASGAPADVFASANNKQMGVVEKSGQIKKSNEQIFARNKLVVIYPKDNPANIHTLRDLARPGLRLDLAAKEVPAGSYSLAFLDATAHDPKYGALYKKKVLSNVVSYEENVEAVARKVSLGDADAGIVYESDAASDKNSLGELSIPAKLNQIATYPIAPVKNSEHSALAREWIEYVLSARGQRVLQKYGFLPAVQK